jgi:hypothetical protein
MEERNFAGEALAKSPNSTDFWRAKGSLLYRMRRRFASKSSQTRVRPRAEVRGKTASFFQKGLDLSIYLWQSALFSDLVSDPDFLQKEYIGPGHTVR